jgi:hypothetical protein
MNKFTTKALLTNVRSEEIEGRKFEVHSFMVAETGSFDAWLDKNLAEGTSEDKYTDYGLPVEIDIELTTSRNKLKAKVTDLRVE